MDDRASLTATRLSSTLIVVLFLLWLSVFLNYIDRSNLSIAAPQLKSELGLSATQLGLLLSAFFWTYASLQIPAGWLVDRLEVKWVFATGFLVWSAATAVTGALHTFAALLTVRILLGIGESVAYPSYSKIIANHFPLSRRGLANAVVSSGLCFGPSFGMLFGGLLMARVGWRPFFLVLGSVSFLWLAPWSIWMPRLTRHSLTDHHHSPNLRDIVMRRTWLATALGLFSLNYVNYFLLTWLPFYLVHERGFTMDGMAKIGGSTMLVAALSALASGRLSDRWINAGATTTLVRRGFMVVGGIVAGFFLVASVVASRNTSVVLLMLAGVGFGMETSNVWAITQTLAGPKATGRWAGCQNCLSNLAGAVGPALTGILVDRTGHFFWPFVIAGAVAWAGSAVWIVLLGPIEPVVWKPSLRATGIAIHNRTTSGTTGALPGEG
jgi:MFS transporter, ACS family, D-galactonate transporter